MSASEPRDLDVAVRPVRGPVSPRRPWLAALALAALLAAVVILGVGGRAPDTALPAVSPSSVRAAVAVPTADATPAAPTSTPVPVPSRIVPFVLQATSDGPATYVSPNLGFAAPLAVDAAHVTGSWAEGGRLADSGGIITFAAGSPEPGGAYSHVISVAVGSEVNPAPIRLVSKPSAPGSSSPVGLWDTSLAGLIQDYAQQTGTSGPSKLVLVGGERGLLLTRPPGGGAVVLAFHAGRVYILSTRGAHRDDPSPAPDFGSFIAGFRFIDPADGT